MTRSRFAIYWFDAVVRGTVVSRSSHWLEDGPHIIVTDVTVRITENWKGSLDVGRTVTLRVNGGEGGEMGMRQEHQADGRGQPQQQTRFQRRGAYRVRTIERYGPTARLAHPAIPDMQLALRVLDVSVGGCALWQPDDVPALAAGVTIAGVDIALDGETRFHAALTLHHLSSLAPHGRGVRVGCEWQLAGPAERSLQRWIDQTQKRRRLLTLG